MFDVTERLREARESLANLEREQASAGPSKRAAMGSYYKNATQVLTREIAQLENEKRGSASNGRALTRGDGLEMARLLGASFRGIEARLDRIEAQLNSRAKARPSSRTKSSRLPVVRLDGTRRPALPVVKLVETRRPAALPVVRLDGTRRPAALPVVRLPR